MFRTYVLKGRIWDCMYLLVWNLLPFSGFCWNTCFLCATHKARNLLLEKNTRELLLAFPLKMWVTSFSVICVTAILNKSNTRTTLPFWKYHQKLGIPNFAPACQHFTELHIVLYSPTPATKHNQFHPPASIFRACLVSIQTALPGSSCNPRLWILCSWGVDCCLAGFEPNRPQEHCWT
jgi:hypothetical protein